MSWRILDLLFTEGSGIVLQILGVLVRNTIDKMLQPTSTAALAAAFLNGCRRWCDTYEFDRMVRAELFNLPLDWRTKGAGLVKATSTEPETAPGAASGNGRSTAPLPSLLSPPVVKGPSSPNELGGLVNLHFIVVEARDLLPIAANDAAGGAAAAGEADDAAGQNGDPRSFGGSPETTTLDSSPIGTSPAGRAKASSSLTRPP